MLMGLRGLREIKQKKAQHPGSSIKIAKQYYDNVVYSPFKQMFSGI